MNLPSPSSLDYLTIFQVETALSDASLEDLVAVFTTNGLQGGLLVYNAPSPPPLPFSLEEAGWQVASLITLRSNDYARFDGPVLTLAAIDVLLEDIPTHGAHFYPLEDLNLFRKPENQKIFRQTAAGLVNVVRERWAQPSRLEQARRNRLFCKRIVQLCLPVAFDAHQVSNLVALRFDFSNPGQPIDPVTFAHPIFDRPDSPDDILGLENLKDSEWVVGLKDLPLLVPSLNQHMDRLLMLRPAFRKFAGQDLLASACRHLALRCWRAWTATQELELLEAAYTLAAEAWLEGEDATDLVAILPDADFDQFVSKGKALAISRVPIPTAPGMEKWLSLEDVLRQESRELSGPVLALPVLGSVFRQRGATNVIDLGPLLWQADRYTDLARTLWLLSRDLLQPPSQEWQKIGASLESISDLAQRAALIYGLGNPWDWRQGRYTRLVEGCYAHLDRCLEQQELNAHSPSLAPYYGILRAWYGCVQTQDVMGNLKRIVEHSHTFITASEVHEASTIPSSKMDIATKLRETAEHLLHPDIPTTPYENQHIISVAELLREITQSTQPVPLPSAMFNYWLQNYLETHHRWQRVQVAAAEQRPDPQELERLQVDLTRWQRRVYAPQHELQILASVLKTEGEQIQRLQQAMEGGAVIKIITRTSEVSLGNKQTIVLEIQNNGSQSARNLSLILERFSGLELASGLIILESVELGPGERERADIQLRAIEPTPTMVFVHRFRDKAGRLHMGEDRVILQARSDVRGIRSKVNPFEIGRPVTGGNFFNRRDEIARILTRLARRDTHPLVLRGPRRIGKSSLLREISLLIDRPSGIEDTTLSPELQSTLHFLRPITASLQRIDASLPHAFEGFMSSLLRDVCHKLALEPEPITRSFTQAAAQYGVPYAFTEQIAHILQLRPEERLVILLDELDEVFRDEAHEMAKQLRNIIESETRRISWIAASTMLVRGSVGKYGSPWFNLLEPIELRAMDWASAFQLLRRLGSNAGFEWSEEAITATLELSGCRPYLTQLLGARTTDDINAQGRDRVESNDVAAAANALLDEITLTGSYLGFVWHEGQWFGKLMIWHVLNASQPLTQVELSRQIQRQVMASKTSVDIGRFNKTFDERMAWLTDIADVLEIHSTSTQSNGRRGRINFAIPLVQRWLQRMIGREPEFVERAVTGIFAELQE